MRAGKLASYTAAALTGGFGHMRLGMANVLVFLFVGAALRAT